MPKRRLIETIQKRIDQLNRKKAPLVQLANASDPSQAEIEDWIKKGKPSGGRISRLLSPIKNLGGRVPAITFIIALANLKATAQDKVARIEFEIRSLTKEVDKARKEIKDLDGERRSASQQISSLKRSYIARGCGPTILLRSF